MADIVSGQDVDLITGQTGVDGGAGSTTAKTVRVSLASDSGMGVPATGTTQLGKAEGGPHTAGNTGILPLSVAKDVASMAAFTGVIAGDYVPFGADTEGSAINIGNRRHDDVDSGGPVKVGARAIAHGTNPTAVAAADRTDLYANRAGVLFTIGGHPNVVCSEFNFTTAQTNAALITVGSGVKIVVTKISVMNGATTTVNVGVRIGFAAATLTAVSGSGVTGIVLSHTALSPGSGIVEGTGAGMIGVGADGEDLRITCDAATSGGFRVLVSYYTIES